MSITITNYPKKSIQSQLHSVCVCVCSDCRCSRHDSRGRAITSAPCFSFYWTTYLQMGRGGHCLSHSSCLSRCQPLLPQSNKMTVGLEGFSRLVYSSKVESTQQNHSQWRHGVTVWMGFIMSLFVLVCVFFPPSLHPNRFTAVEMNFNRVLSSTMKSAKPMPNCLILFITWVIT